MGYAIMVGQCCVCHNVVAFNPKKVPCLVIDGVRRELCEMCARRWNELHPDQRREIMEGAYEPTPEEEL